MKSFILCKRISLLLALSLLLLPLGGCAEPTDGVPADKGDAQVDPSSTAPRPAANLDITDVDPTEFAVNQRGFAAELLQQVSSRQVDANENILLSPLSAMLVLSLAATGAEGETRAQMEQMLGTSDADVLAEQLAAYVLSLPCDEFARVQIANSVWLRDAANLEVDEEFLQRAAELYDAEVYTEPFDGTTAGKINAWVSEKTEGMIDHLLNEVDPSALVYLLNALLFDAQWASSPLRKQYRLNFFTPAEGEAQDANVTEFHPSILYDDGYALGTRLAYENGYSLIAMLPDREMGMEEYIATLSGEWLSAMLRDGKVALVDATLPHFAYESEYSLNDVLIDMGMETAFVPAEADFSSTARMPDQNLYIGMVLQKTAIELNEIGTRAAAVTAIVEPGSAPPGEEPQLEKYTLIYDRPFVYMIVDRKNVPLFIGVVNSVKTGE